MARNTVKGVLVRNLARPLLVIAVLVLMLFGGLGFMTWMPGTDESVIERPLNAEEIATAERLKRRVEFLASGPRNRVDAPEREDEILAYLQRGLAEAGWEPHRQEVTTADGAFHNITARRAGTTRPEEVIVVGAHWDTRGPTPGADDNASGCAALLELAAWLAERETARTIELVFWANEEPPYFQTSEMGSLQHARALRAAGTNVVVAISLEMLGYYDPTPGSQKYPAILSAFYPDHGAFIAVVGSMWHRDVVTRSVGAFRDGSDFPVYGFAGPESMPGIGFSDQWSFWETDFPAFMVTDTSFFRTPHYHQHSDTPDTLDYNRFARVVIGLREVLAHWVDGELRTP